MKAKLCYTKENFTEVELNGNTYPLMFNFHVAEQLQNEFGAGFEMSKLLSDSKSRTRIFEIFLNAAVRISHYFGKDVPTVTLEELELFLTAQDHMKLRSAIYEAVIKTLPQSEKSDTESEWTPEDRAKLTNAPKPDEDEEKN